MKLYIYQGLENEKVPKDVTHVIVDSSVTVIKKEAFSNCEYLVSVIMGDNVKRIEGWAFVRCRALRFIRLSKALEYIGDRAFWCCKSLEALFLPSTVTSIENLAFASCQSLRFLILPYDIHLNNVGNEIIRDTCVVEASGVAYDYEDIGGGDTEVTDESNGLVNEWLVHHMDAAPFHKLCYNSTIATKQINDYLHEHGNDSALAIDTIHGMTPLHMLSMNPHAPADTILTLLKANINAANVEDNRGNTPLYYALYHNPCGFVRMYSYLREHTNTIENEIQSLVVIPDYDGGGPLHVLAKNPFAPANTIAAFLELKMEAAFCPDNEGLSPLDYAKECNVDSLIAMIAVLCNHRNSMSSMEGGEEGSCGTFKEEEDSRSRVRFD